MKALCWHGKGDVRIDTVPDPTVESPRDAIVRITSTAICGSDLHLLDGYMPTMKSGDVLDHEFMGEIMEVGVESRGKLSVGGEWPIAFSAISRLRLDRSRELVRPRWQNQHSPHAMQNGTTTRSMKKIEAGEIDPSSVITHRASLDDAPDLYKTFRDHEDGCIKVVLKPGESSFKRADRASEHVLARA